LFLRGYVRHTFLHLCPEVIGQVPYFHRFL
jgi:hypothetical protein